MLFHAFYVLDPVSDDDSDEDIGRVPQRKKRARAILISPDTPSTGRTPLRSKVTAPTSTKKVLVILLCVFTKYKNILLYLPFIIFSLDIAVQIILW